MFRFTDLTFSPPGGRFPYLQQETGFRFAELDFESLLKVVKAHRDANNLPIGTNFRYEVMDECCRELLSTYPNWTGAIDDEGRAAILPGRKWNLEDVKGFLTTVTKFFMSGGSLVAQEEANRRADICTRCPKNADMAECWSCRGVTGIIQNLRKGKTTPSDDRLKICMACGCDLKTKVWLEKDVMQREGVVYDPKCWMIDNN